MLNTKTLEIVGAGGLGLLAVVLGGTLIAWSVRNRRRRPLPLDLDLSEVKSVEDASTQVLQYMARWMPVQAGFAYWRSSDGARYRLRATLEAPPAPGSIGPAYSGIASDAVSKAPVVLPASEIPEKITVFGPRKERWVWIPFAAGQFAVRVLLTRGTKLSAATRGRIEASVSAHSSLIYAIGHWLVAHESAERLKRMAFTSRVTIDTGTQLDGALELLLKIGGRIVGSKLQFALIDSSDGRVRLSDSEDGLAWADKTLSGGSLSDLLIIESNPDVIHLGERSTQGLVACARVPILASGRAVGCFYLLLDSADPLTPFELAGLRALGQRAAQVIDGQQHMREAARSYIGTLEALVQSMDALAPTSIGHSDRSARYARMISEEMGLSHRETEDIVLAAKLHDVGMIGVDARLVLKPDQFTVDEFELMKGHAELGGQLLQSLAQGPAVSQIVSAHHERWDGAGYPLGLSGDDIPLGARIIAAVDYFEAKTTGRSYRSAIPFNVALEDVRKASGSAFDPQVVEALRRAMERQRGRSSAGLPPLPCWQLKAAPEHVCAGCPNRLSEPVRCWEQPGNLCTRHGDRCETCIVYTEAVTRALVNER